MKTTTNTHSEVSNETSSREAEIISAPQVAATAKAAVASLALLVSAQVADAQTTTKPTEPPAPVAAPAAPKPTAEKPAPTPEKSTTTDKTPAPAVSETKANTQAGTQAALTELKAETPKTAEKSKEKGKLTPEQQEIIKEKNRIRELLVQNEKLPKIVARRGNIDVANTEKMVDYLFEIQQLAKEEDPKYVLTIKTYLHGENMAKRVESKRETEAIKAKIAKRDEETAANNAEAAANNAKAKEIREDTDKRIAAFSNSFKASK